MSSINEKLEAGATLTRHLHVKPYITLVLHGSYTEAGDHGRFHVRPGDILLHGHYSAHANWISRRRDVTTLNIEVDTLPDVRTVCRSERFDHIVRYAKYDTPLAIDELISSLQPKPHQITDWPDTLAGAIIDDPGKTIGHWCQVLELAPATVSRGFKRAFGVTVAQFRVIARTRGALMDLASDAGDLSELAYRWGYSDQSHFNRAILSLTGQTPRYWQKVKNIQELPCATE